MEYRLQEGGSSSVPSLMVLRLTKNERQLSFFSVLNFFSSSFIFLSFFWLLLFWTTIVVSWVFLCWFWFCFIRWRGLFVFSLVLLEECARMLGLLWSFFEWTWCQNMGGAWTISVGVRTHLCVQSWTYRIRIFEELGAWRNRFLHSSWCVQSLCFWPWQQLFRYASLPPLCFFPCLNMFKVSSLQDAWSLAHRDP